MRACASFRYAEAFKPIAELASPSVGLLPELPAAWAIWRDHSLLEPLAPDPLQHGTQSALQLVHPAQDVRPVKPCMALSEVDQPLDDFARDLPHSSWSFPGLSPRRTDALHQLANSQPRAADFACVTHDKKR